MNLKKYIQESASIAADLRQMAEEFDDRIAYHAGRAAYYQDLYTEALRQSNDEGISGALMLTASAGLDIHLGLMELPL